MAMLVKQLDGHVTPAARQQVPAEVNPFLNVQRRPAQPGDARPRPGRTFDRLDRLPENVGACRELVLAPDVR